MPFQQPEHYSPPAAAEVRPAEPMQRHFPLLKENAPEAAPLSQATFNPQMRVVVSPPEKSTIENFDGISNRPEGGRYKMIYINGIRTQSEDAEKSSKLVKRSLGIEDCDVIVLYNPAENACSSGVKILGSLASSRLGRKAEPECIGQLKQYARSAIEQPNDRLIIVGHSHGSLIIQNAFDRLYDEYQKSPTEKRKWEEQTPRIEVIMYAPLVRTMAPGPQAVSLLNSLDLPARSIGGMQRLVANSKHYAGWREQQTIQTVIYNPARNKFPDVIIDPSIVHDSCDLILDNIGFNFQVLSQDPHSKKPDPQIFANNLAASIRYGKRSDLVHHELIIKGCETFGKSFAVPFCYQLEPTESASAKCIGKFIIRDARLNRIENLIKKQK